MQDTNKKMGEMFAATQALLAALTEKNLDAVHVASSHLSQAFESSRSQMTTDFSGDADSEEKRSVREQWGRLVEMSSICLRLAQDLRDGVAQDLQQLKVIRQAVDAAWANTQATNPMLDQSA